MGRAENHLPRRAAWWLLAAAAVTLAPHTLYMPSWISVACALLLLWQASLLWSNAPAASRLRRYLLLAVALAAVAGVRIEFGYFFGKAPGIALLAILMCLKLLEAASARDLRAAVLLAFFLQLGLFFDDQTLAVAAIALLGALLATATMLTIEDPALDPLRTLRTGGVLMLQALPFLVVLFVLFPRLPGPLWGLPADAYAAMTGLSDEMSPGSIAELGLSDKIALRAEFDGPPPPASQRYWRGPVLTQFDGRVWRMARTPSLSGPAYTPSGPGYAYILTLEPHNQRWILALDFPGDILSRSSIRHSGDYQLVSDAPVRARMQFDLNAWPESSVGIDESRSVLDTATRLPEDASPRTRALVEELVADARSPPEVLDLVIAYFRASELVYTLSPPLLEDHPVDEFLFDARRGFCEHFTSAFVFMMRAAGVPARVVTGYQGGAINSVDGSVVVRQSDAHAWAEIWLAERGWVRVDPTALAAPSRIERGMSAAIPAGDPRTLLMREGAALDWLRGMRDRWEALSNAWNRNVLGFDQGYQQRLLSRFGLEKPDWRSISVVLGLALSLLMLALITWAVFRRADGDALDRIWRRFSAKLAHHGLARLQSEGPIDYADRVARALPAHAAEVHDIAATYARLRYGAASPASADLTRQLAQRIREFSPR